MAQTHYVGRDAPAVRLQSLQGSAPLESIQRVAVNKQRGYPATAFDVGNITDRQFRELSRCIKGLRIDRFCVCGSRVCRRRGQERRTCR
jgi:hypothetical protein